MSRPKYRQGDKTARDRLNEAFWKCIEEMPYNKMTVLAVCERAGLNKNSFYYHYEDMDDMARSIVNETLERDFPAIMLSQINEGLRDGLENLMAKESTGKKFDHICLLAGKNSSPELQAMLKTMISSVWCDYLSIDPDSLSQENRIIFEFCLGGIFSLLAYRSNTNSNITIGDMIPTDFGKSILTAIMKLSAS
jgi:AcrR family transcriptional regulator